VTFLLTVVKNVTPVKCITSTFKIKSLVLAFQKLQLACDQVFVSLSCPLYPLNLFHTSEEYFDNLG